MIIPGDDDKGRVFGCIVYPESVKSNWKEILVETGYKIAISPLHDKDLPTNSDMEFGMLCDKKFLKPHYHIIVRAEGPITYRTFKREVIDSINAYKYGIIIKSINGAFTYLTHESYKAILNNKHIYNQEDITYINSTAYDFKKCEYRDVITIIEDNNLYCITDLIKYLMGIGNNELLKFVSKNTYYINTVINDFKNKDKLMLEHKIKEVTDLLNDINDEMSVEETKKIIQRFEQIQLEFDIQFRKEKFNAGH